MDWYLSVNGRLLTHNTSRVGDTTGYYRDNPYLFSYGTGGASALQDIPVTPGDVKTLNVALDGSSYQGWGGALGVDLTITSGVPEPTSLSILGLGTIGLLIRRRRQVVLN